MTEELASTENTANQRRMRCLGRLSFTVPMVLVCLLLALGDPFPVTATVLVVGLWLWLAIFVIVGIARVWKAIDKAVETQEDPWNSIFTIPRICSWASLLLLVVATAALFAAGEPLLAKSMEVLLFLPLVVEIGARKQARQRKSGKEETAETPGVFSTMGVMTILTIVGALWIALGAPPVWAESMILTWVWILALLMIFGGSVFAWAFTFGPGMRKRHWEELRRSGAHPDLPASRPEPVVTPEPPRTGRQQLVMWLFRAGWIVGAWALWTTGEPLLAGLYLLGMLLLLSGRTRERRWKHGDTARIDFLARAVDFVIWWPFIAAGTVVIIAFLAPLCILSAIWDRIVGTAKSGRPEPQTNWEREARLERARVRRVGASYRLREAFDHPDGFIYFLYSEPHQREHFLGAGGLLADLGERIVARDWRNDVTPARSKRFEHTPEGALLHVNSVASMQKDLPFIAVVPARGIVQVFRLSEVYRSRNRDKGAALVSVEVEIKAAIEVALKAGARGSESC